MQMRADIPVIRNQRDVDAINARTFLRTLAGAEQFLRTLDTNLVLGHRARTDADVGPAFPDCCARSCHAVRTRHWGTEFRALGNSFWVIVLMTQLHVAHAAQPLQPACARLAGFRNVANRARIVVSCRRHGKQEKIKKQRSNTCNKLGR